MNRKIILLALLLLGACSGNMERGLYEGIKGQNDAYKTPAEKAMTPTPDYDTYKKEREKLEK